MIALLLATTIAGTNVQGTITLANGKPARQAVVYLEGQAKAKPLDKAVVDQRNMTFKPHISVVTVGTEIQFPNNDAVFHNVFAEFDAKRFDLGMYPKGTKKTQRFDKTGLVAILCSVHSEMSAYVMIVDTPFYALTDAKGNYKIPNSTAGDYTLRVWHESGEKHSRKVSVDGPAQTLDATTSKK